MKAKITKVKWLPKSYIINFKYNGITKELFLCYIKKNEEYLGGWYLFEDFWANEFWIAASEKLKNIREYLRDEFNLY